MAEFAGVMEVKCAATLPFAISGQKTAENTYQTQPEKFRKLRQTLKSWDSDGIIRNYNVYKKKPVAKQKTLLYIEGGVLATHDLCTYLSRIL